MIKLRWKDKWIDFESVQWSGTDNQCSRQLTFTLASNPYDKDFKQQEVKLGDLMYLYDNSKQLFVGVVTSREKKAEIGTATYIAKDFMHYLLKSNGSYNFQKTTPEKIVKKICTDLEIATKKLAKTKANIEKLIFEDVSYYDIMITAYRKARAKTNKNYMPIMSGKKVSVIVKGEESGVVLTQGVDITNASYSDTTDNMVNLVRIYDDSMNKLGQVQNKSNVNKYGVYAQTYQKEEGVDAKKEAEAMFVGITKEASVEAIGNVKAISGYSIEISDKATGLTGTFYITSDTHVFANGVHTMTLELSWKNTMEGADAKEENAKSEGNIKTPITNSAKCYYLPSGTVYHSKKTCPACKGKKNFKTSTVAEMKKIKITVGKNKGKRKYKACSRCWET